MNEITPTAAERSAGRLAAAAVRRAVTALLQDGFVVLDEVVAHDHLDRLRERMTCDLEKIRALPVVPHNFVWGNIQQQHTGPGGVSPRAASGLRAAVGGYPQGGGADSGHAVVASRHPQSQR